MIEPANLDKPTAPEGVWMPQMSLREEHCSACRAAIPAQSRYWRWALEPDGRDEQGADFCPPCLAKQYAEA
jgi:hypothetical protein